MIPTDRKYTETHEWIKVEDELLVVGITDHAQDALGDITFVELPQLDMEYNQGDECCVVESVKAASDIIAPLTGTVTEINTELENNPEIINRSPYESGWIFKLRDFDKTQLDSLIDHTAYADFLENE